MHTYYTTLYVVLDIGKNVHRLFLLGRAQRQPLVAPKVNPSMK
jgi:hypothetical protein